MPDIKISIKNKRAVLEDNSPVIVCGNSNYNVAFTFDNEWSSATYKTARFVYVQNGKVKHTDIDFTGTKAKVPVLANTTQVKVGVFAGELYTSTPAVIACKPSILCGSGEPTVPTPEEDARIIELLNLAISQQAQTQAAVNTVKASETAAAASAAEAKDVKDYVNGIIAGNEAYTKYESGTQYASAIKLTATGENITVNDSSNAPCVIGLEGKSEQKQYEGRNLINITDFTITATETQTHIFRQIDMSTFIKSNTTFIVSFYTDFTDRITLSIFNQNITINGTATIKKAENGRVVWAFTTAEDITNYTMLLIYAGTAGSTNGNTVDVRNLQIELGETATAYEPYCGGIPSPNPDYPQEINSVADSGSVEVVSCGKNLWWFGDLNDIIGTLPKMSCNYVSGTYTMSFLPSVSTGATDFMFYDENETMVLKLPIGNSLFVNRNSITFELPVTAKYIYIYSNTNVTYADIQLELSNTATPYEPYQGTKATLTLAEPLRSLPNGTKDTIERNADGSYKVVRRVGIYSLRENRGGIYTLEDGRKVLTISTLDKIKSWSDKKATSYCTNATLDLKHDKTDVGMYCENTNNFAFYGTTEDTLESLRARYNGGELHYLLATPTEELLSAENIVEIQKLRTFESVTNVNTNDTLQPKMTLTYNADTKTYIDNKITEVCTAILNN